MILDLRLGDMSVQCRVSSLIIVSFRSLHHFSRWPCLVQQVCPCTIGNVSILQNFLGRAGQTNLLRSPCEETVRVSSRVACAQVLLVTNSCCGHTKQLDQAVRHSAVDEQEFELVRSSFRSNVVQIVCVLFGFGFGFVQVPRSVGANGLANVRSLHPCCAVRGLRVPHRSIIYVRDT